MKTPVVFGVATSAALAGSVAAAAHSGSPIRVDGIETTDMWAALFLGLFALAFAFYVAALVVLRRARCALAFVATLAIVIQLIPLAGPLLISRDVYSYWAYGRIVATHDQNPFTAPPGRFPHDPATQAASWRRQTSVYGPAFVSASAGVAEVTRRSVEVAPVVFRAIAAVAGIVAMLLAALIARRKAYAAAFVGWNPLVALSFAGGGHNDAWMVVLLLGALALVVRRRDVEAGTLWILAAAIKAPALLLLALQLVRSRRGLWLGAAGAAAVTGVASTAAFGTAWLTASLQLAGREAQVSLAARLEQIGLPDVVAHGLPLAVLAIGTAYLVHRAREGRPSLALGALLIVVTSPWVLPWYATWPVALAAVEDNAVAQIAALGLSFYLLPDRVPL